jgi:hypothetical protein
MKNSLLLTAFTLVSLFAFSQTEKVINDKNAEKRSAQGFHGIQISGGIDLYLTQSGDEAVAVSAADPEVRDHIKVEVVDGILKIYVEDRGFHWNWHNQHMKAYVSCKTLSQLHASGGSDVFIDNPVHSEGLRMDLSGGSDFHGKLNVTGELAIHQSGGSDSYIIGSAGTLTLHISGGSDFHGYDLTADQCQVDATGGSDAYVSVNKELTANASGGSDVHYKGNGVVRSSHASGSGSISRRD